MTDGAVLRSLRAFAPAILWAAAVWLVGGMENVPSTPAVPGLDKVAHFGMYGVLGFLIGRGWVQVGSPLGRYWPVLLVMAIGAADEYRQSRTQTRTAEFADWLADAAGAGCGFVLASRTTRRRSDDE